MSEPKKKRKAKAADKPAENPWPARLKALRIHLGKISQAEAARRLGMSLRMYLYYESGSRVPSGPALTLLDQFCRFPENFSG